MLNDIDKMSKNFNYANLHNKELFTEFLKFLTIPYDQIPLIVYDKHIWINSLIVPKKYIKPDNFHKLFNWSFVPCSYGYSVSSNNKYELCGLCESYDPQEILKNATPIFLERDVFKHTDRIIEINQEISHRLDFVEEEKNHFYKLNERGDKEEIGRIYDEEDITLCNLNQKELNKYLCISSAVLIRFFNVSIFKEVSFENRIKNNKKYKNIFYTEDICYNPNNEVISKEIRGFQIIDSVDIEDKKRIYEEFTVLDLETNHVVVNSCNPSKLKNYFVESDNIYETSPVFFNTEVLIKYQNNSDKYNIDNRYIECKGIWSLRYSISDNKSQVIVYIGDLSYLPNYEQKYWKSFNEEPKSKISKHVFVTDFLGKWDNVIDPLISMKECLSQFPSFYINENEYKMWTEKNKNNIRSLDNLQYIKHPTKENWESEIKKLHQILVEGFNEKNIKMLAKKLDCYYKDYKSLNQLKECIKILFNDKKAERIMKPFINLNTERIKTEHSNDTSEYPKNIIKEYDEIIHDCYVSMKWLSEQIEKGKFNV